MTTARVGPSDWLWKEGANDVTGCTRVNYKKYLEIRHQQTTRTRGTIKVFHCNYTCYHLACQAFLSVDHPQ